MSSRFKARYRRRCIYCGDRIKNARIAYSYRRTTDHVEPLSRGGEDSEDNIVMCCHGCNASKGDRFLLEWVWSGRYFFRLNGMHSKAYGRYYRSGRWPSWIDEDEIARVKRNAVVIPNHVDADMLVTFR